MAAIDQFDIYLDANRVFRASAPTGSVLPNIPAGWTPTTIGSTDYARITSAQQAAQAAGMDLVVATDLTTSQVTHTPTARDQAFTILSNYVQNATPTAADTVQALKTLIRVVRNLV